MILQSIDHGYKGLAPHVIAKLGLNHRECALDFVACNRARAECRLKLMEHFSHSRLPSPAALALKTMKGVGPRRPMKSKLAWLEQALSA
jgi:hypothetical protein